MRRPRTPRLPVLGLTAVALLVVMGVGALMSHRQDHRQDPPPAAASTSSLLVLTWAPSLCLVETSASGCSSGRVAGRGQSLLLHGLWPQPKEQRYCGVSPQGRGRAPLDLPQDLRSQLAAVMSDSTVAAPHQWYAHGTCSGVGASEFFSIATALADEAIAVLDPVFDRAAGRELSVRSLRETFDKRFGRNTGARVSLSCRGGRGGDAIVFEVRLSLPAVADLAPDTPPLADALAAAPSVSPGCGRGRLP